MSKRVLVLAAFAALLVPATSQAVDHTGQWALGWYDREAPIGVRYQFSEKAAVDFGFGLSSAEGVDYASTTPDTKNFLDYAVEVGVPVTLVRADRADFFFRPGLRWTSTPYQFDDGVNPVSDERASDIGVKLHLGAEWHATDRFSITAGHGVEIASSKGVSSGQLVTGAKPESSTSWSTGGFDVTQLGFRFYF